MNEASLHDRTALAAKLMLHKQAVAEEVTDEFFRRHPEWLVRYGDRGRARGLEDASFHVEFLAGAVEAGAAAPFEDYARWTVRVLEARGIASSFVAENLSQVESALARHLSDDGERALIARLVGAAVRACSAGVPAAAPLAAGSPLAISQRLFLQTILRGQRRASANVALDLVRQGMTVADLYCDVIQHALYEVGRLWESNAITVADEHMATATAQRVLAEVYAEAPIDPIKRGTAVVTGVVGELHQMGANMIADVLEADGWSVRFLGTNMPHAGIVKVIEEEQADVVGISCTMAFNLPKVVELVRTLQASTPRPKILLGGSAFRSAPELIRELGADGHALEVRAAVLTARPWSRSGSS